MHSLIFPKLCLKIHFLNLRPSCSVCHGTLMCRRQGQSGQQPVHQVCDRVPPHPVAPVRPPPLLLCYDGEGAEEVARRAAGLRQAPRQR